MTSVSSGFCAVSFTVKIVVRLQIILEFGVRLFIFVYKQCHETELYSIASSNPLTTVNIWPEVMAESNAQS